MTAPIGNVRNDYGGVTSPATLDFSSLLDRLRRLNRSRVPMRLAREVLAATLGGEVGGVPGGLVTDALRQAMRIANGEGVLGVLMSLPGRGKSHAAAWLLSVKGGVWVHAPDLAIVRDDGETERLDEKMRTASCLVLDDVGIEHSPSGWAAARIIGAIEYREAEELPTLVTTNLSAAQFKKAYDGDRLSSRMNRDPVGFVVCEGEDLRKAPLSSELVARTDALLRMTDTDVMLLRWEWEQNPRKVEEQLGLRVAAAQA